MTPTCQHCGEQVCTTLDYGAPEPTPEERRRREVNAWLLVRANDALTKAQDALKACETWPGDVPLCIKASMALKGLHPVNPHSLQCLSAEALRTCRAAMAAGMQFEALAASLKAFNYAQEWCLPCGLSAMDPALAVSAFSTALQLWEAQEGGQG
jgi:hypothetical protein